MAKYKIWLTVRDLFGNTKELDGGNIDINLDKDDVENIVDNLKDNIDVEVNAPVYVPTVTQDNVLKFKLHEKAAETELEFDIDKSNDWDEMDGTVGSSYVWEPMQ